MLGGSSTEKKNLRGDHGFVIVYLEPFYSDLYIENSASRDIGMCCTVLLHFWTRTHKMDSLRAMYFVLPV